MSDTSSKAERLRRWRLCLGVDGEVHPFELSKDDTRMDAALTALYGNGESQGRRGGLGQSSPRVARWLGDIRQYFPKSVVQTMQKDALERLGLEQMLLEPDLLAVMEADIHLVATLCGLMEVMPEATKETAREVVRSVVEDLQKRLEQKTSESIRGALDKTRRTRRPRFSDIDWGRTIAANLRHYQAEYGSVIPETLIGSSRRSRALIDLEEVVLCVDQSGSMATSVVYSSIFAAVMASLPGVQTKMVAFDTAIFDLTDMLEDPVDVLFGVQLGGGTDINQAVGYCEGLIRQPSQAHLILITDLYEGGDEKGLLARLAALVRNGVNVIVLLALSDDGAPSYDNQLASMVAALGCPVFACTPDQFPALMAVALKREDINLWAAEQNIGIIRGGDHQ